MTDNVVGFHSSPTIGWGANYNYFRDYIFEIMIFNRELTAAERGTLATNYFNQRFNFS